jgi:hypothetical protein
LEPPRRGVWGILEVLRMSDDLVYRIFVEMAVLEGKREVDGRWAVSDGQEIQRLLKRAFATVTRAASLSDDDVAAGGLRASGGGGAGKNQNRP